MWRLNNNSWKLVLRSEWIILNIQQSLYRIQDQLRKHTLFVRYVISGQEINHLLIGQDYCADLVYRDDSSMFECHRIKPWVIQMNKGYELILPDIREIIPEAYWSTQYSSQWEDMISWFNRLIDLDPAYKQMKIGWDMSVLREFWAARYSVEDQYYYYDRLMDRSSRQQINREEI